MSEEANMERQINEEKKKTRRTRKDEDGRNFQCPCGKSYLSYPALYTHIKTKHQGKAPKEGEFPTAKQEVEDEENDEKDPLNTMKDYINKQFPQETLDPSQSNLTTEEKNLIKEFQDAWSAEKQIYQSNPSTNNPNATIDLIFGKFIYEMKQRLKPKGMQYIYKFVYAFYKEIIEQKNEPNYCKENTGSQLPYFFNDLIVRSALPTIEHVEEHQDNFYPAFACKNLFFFGRWIFQQRFTNYSVKFNSN